jgi:hypothetical protein
LVGIYLQGPDEFVNTYQALSVNTSLPMEERLSLINEILEPKLFARWNRWRYHKPLLHTLALSMAKLKKVDHELCAKVLKSIAHIKSVTVEVQVEVYNAYSALATQVLVA